jgi:hypothetical protein
MNRTITTRSEVHFKRRQHGQKTLAEGAVPPSKPRVPRISRLMALAIRFDRLIRSGEVADQAELARLGLVTRARMTQIMDLLNLAPDIQEQLLYLPAIDHGRDAVTERTLRPVVADLDWGAQRAKWKRLCPTAP